MAKTIHAVGILIENKKGEILVLLRQKDRPEPNTYGLPGGKVELNEATKNACIRETYEETKLNVNPKDLEHLKTYNDWQSSGLDIKFEIFRYWLNEENPEIILEPTEATSYMWQTPKELYKRKDLMVGLYIILKDIYKL